jgi:hypothetical protein
MRRAQAPGSQGSRCVSLMRGRRRYSLHGRNKQQYPGVVQDADRQDLTRGAAR